jgi:thiamine biosynthesis lipoprotein
MAINQRSTPAPRAVAAVGGAPLERVVFRALGTECEVQFTAPDPVVGKAFSTAAVAWVQAFEAKYSRFRPDSVISQINDAAGRDWIAIDAEAEEIFAVADQVYTLTRGVLDPTLLPLLRVWNYKAASPRLPSEAEVAAALRLVGWPRVRREPGRIMLPETGMGLDLGGFGKEYAVDCVAALGRAHGLANVLVDFGHDVSASGGPPDAPCWMVGVENPQKLGTSLMALALHGRGVASSGNGIRCFTIDGRRYGHIIDPRNGSPVWNGVQQVTVVANSCLEAGLLSTTAVVLGPEEGTRLVEEFFGAEALILGDGCEFQTRGFCQYVV